MTKKGGKKGTVGQQSGKNREATPRAFRQARVEEGVVQLALVPAASAFLFGALGSRRDSLGVSV